MFLKLTYLNDAAVVVNMDNVQHIDEGTNKSVIRTVNGDTLEVRETADEIAELANKEK